MRSQLKRNRRWVSVTLISCLIWAFTCEVPGIDNSEEEFFLTKEWKIKEYIAANGGGVDNEGDIANFRLNLKEDFTFTRVCIDDNAAPPCSEAGTWRLSASGTQLILTSEVPVLEETYLIVSFKVRELQMDLVGYIGEIIDDNKVGCNAYCTRLILQPVKN